MEVSRDFEEFLGLLNKHSVRYLVVGGYAFAIHARPRYTNDLDIWVEAQEANAERALEALKDFGFGDVGIELPDLVSPERVIQLGYPPLRIDLMTSISGVEFAKAWENKVDATYGKTQVHFIGKNDLIVNKRASGRKKDLSDLDELL